MPIAIVFLTAQADLQLRGTDETMWSQIHLQMRIDALDFVTGAAFPIQASMLQRITMVKASICWSGPVLLMYCSTSR